MPVSQSNEEPTPRLLRVLPVRADVSPTPNRSWLPPCLHGPHTGRVGVCLVGIGAPLHCVRPLEMLVVLASAAHGGPGEKQSSPRSRLFGQRSVFGMKAERPQGVETSRRGYEVSRSCLPKTRGAPRSPHAWLMCPSLRARAGMSAGARRCRLESR